MTKVDYMPGHASLSDLFYWMKERHAIWIRRNRGEPKPWTDDPILQQWKFTNVFRELDRGTLWLRERLDWRWSATDTLFAIIVYRLFNRTTTGDLLWPITLERWNNGEIAAAARDASKRGVSLFTSAHMTTGRKGETKLETNLDTFQDLSGIIGKVTKDIENAKTLEKAFAELIDWNIYGVGKFIAYEIVSDLRWTPLLDDAEDKLSWANIGPGCRRGLERLGLEGTVASLQHIYDTTGGSPTILGQDLFEHHAGAISSPKWPPLELREIEHSLCEFDKYQRVKTGAGQPREKYDGVLEVSRPH